MNDYIMQYNLTVQRDVSHNMVATIAYLVKANHLFVGQETNGCLPTGVMSNGLLIRGTSPTYLLPVPLLIRLFVASSIVFPTARQTTTRFSSRSIVRRAMAQFRLSYTFSKCLDMGSYYTGNDSIGSATAPRLAFRLAIWPAVFRTSATARATLTSEQLHRQRCHSFPSRETDSKVVGRTAIGTILSGTPFSVFDGFDEANVGAGGAANDAERPELVPGRSSNPTGRRNTSSGIFWFDPTAFQVQPVGIFGDLGRNTLIAGFQGLRYGPIEEYQDHSVQFP